MSDWSYLDALLEASIDRARSIGPPGTTTRMLLQMFALRFLASRNGATEDVWRDIRNEVAHSTSATDVAERLSYLASLIETAAPALHGIFNNHLLPGLRAAKSLLGEWVLLLSPLGISLKEDSSQFGHWFDQTCDSVIARGVGGLQYATPRFLAELMVRLAAPAASESVHDPCAGLGALLAATLEHSRVHKGTIDLSGQEIDVNIAALARLRLFLLGAHGARILVGDILRQPQFADHDKGVLEEFDVVLCDPPYGQRLANVDFARTDKYNRFSHGQPARISSDLAFIQHAIACLNPKGRAVALIPHGPLLRGGADADVRRNILSDKLVDAVIGLPAGTLPGLSLEPALLVLRRAPEGKAEVRGVLFIDASARRDALASDTAWQAFADEILSIYDERNDVAELACCVSMQKIAEHQFSLQPRRYVVRQDQSGAVVDLHAALNEAAALEQQAAHHANVMAQLLERLAPAEQTKRSE